VISMIVLWKRGNSGLSCKSRYRDTIIIRPFTSINGFTNIWLVVKALRASTKENFQKEALEFGTERETKRSGCKNYNILIHKNYRFLLEAVSKLSRNALYRWERREAGSDYQMMAGNKTFPHQVIDPFRKLHTDAEGW